MKDMIDFSRAIMGDPTSPDIRGYEVRAHLSRVHLSSNTREYERGPVKVEFEGRDQLVPAFGNQGNIAYTLWVGRGVEGEWVFAPWVECIGDYVPVGAEFWNDGHVARNLLYWGELDRRVRGWQPAPGEFIAVVCTTGDTRRQDVFTDRSGHPVAKWRTTVAIVRFAPGDYRPPSDILDPTPTPVPIPPPVVVPPAPLPPSDATLLSIEQKFATLMGVVTSMNSNLQLLAAALRDVAETMGDHDDTPPPPRRLTGRIVTRIGDRSVVTGRVDMEEVE